MPNLAEKARQNRLVALTLVRGGRRRPQMSLFA
jgi:hypothetical protein